MGWVNNVITVQALPQDRHISWPTHPFSPSTIQPLLHPAFCPPIPIPLTTGYPSLSTVCVRRSPGYTLVVVCQDTFPLPPRSFPSMHARRAYMHVRTCHVQIAGRRLTASCNTQAKHLAVSRKRARLEK